MTPRIKDLVLVAFCLAYVLAAAGYMLSGAGLHEGECYVGTGALRTIALLGQGRLSDVPLMESFYVGTFLHIISVPFVLLVSDKTLALRIPALIYGAGFVLCMFSVLRRWFGAPAARIALVLVAFDSAFIRSLRFGAEREEMLQIFFVWLGLWFVARAEERGSRRGLLPAAFVWGLALWAKLMFAGYALGFLLAFVCMPRRVLVFARKRLALSGPRAFAGLAAAFVAGSLPLWVYLSKNGLYFLRMVRSSLGPTGAGWDNLDLFQNLLMRFRDAAKLLGSRLYWIDDIFYPFTNAVFPALFAIGVLFLLWRVFSGRARFRAARFMFLLITYAGLLLSSCYVPFGHAIEHVVILIPMAQIVVALFCVEAVRALSFRKAAAAALGLCLCLSLVQEMRITGYCLAAVRDGRLKTDSSPVFEELADRASASGLPVIAPVILRYRLMYHSGLAIEPLCYFNNWLPGELDLRAPERFYLDEMAGLGDFLFVSFSRGEEGEYGERLLSLAAEDGRKAELVGVLRGGDESGGGIELLRVSDSGAHAAAVER